MGMVSKMYFVQDNDEAFLIKNKRLVGLTLEISEYASELELLINATKQRYEENSINLRTG